MTLQPLGPVAAALLLVGACGLVGGLAAGRRGALRWAGLLAAAAGLLASPLLVPRDAVPLPGLVRFLVGFLAVLQLLKLHDLSRDPAPDLRTLLVFLTNTGSVVRRRIGLEPRPTPGVALAAAARGALLALAGVAGCVAVWSSSWPAPGAADLSGGAGPALRFLLAHVARLVVFFVAVVGLAAASTNLGRALGVQNRDVFDRPWAATSPADFWRRYNRIVGQWLADDVFAPLGGRRSPVRATLLAFAVSALLHEWIFSVSAGTLDGHQTAFFLLHGVAVAATLRARPRSPGGRALGWTLTMVFNLATSLLFFASVDRLVPFWPR